MKKNSLPQNDYLSICLVVLHAHLVSNTVNVTMKIIRYPESITVYTEGLLSWKETNKLSASWQQTL